MKAFKLLLLLVLFTSIGSKALAKSKVEISYNSSAELTINNIQIDNGTDLNKLIGVLGEPNRTEEYANGEKSYFYDEVGMVFMTKDGLVKGVGVNFNWDGDKKFPEQSFRGTLKLAETTINKESNSETISGIQGIEFICPIPIMCGSKDRDAKINCTMAFKDGKITQVVFLIK
jgi:hypothetical protein